ncbi:MAG: ABC transporter permease [Nitrososphaerota archaeon]|nr:ABC transporter permease [Nitrososphaerota archaeon]MDG6964215.1 ABC transporter permease [Nitrososphaerota archaeon]MDG6975732.1 ABC transporter permease [Nitrososphaerota archaeon]MDG7009189.1 ABC transporter permease [Nitrososphaerota archaeon]MDG7019922.1 ABC transporter permease [Nitrososphaerota archaeon]
MKSTEAGTGRSLSAGSRLQMAYRVFKGAFFFGRKGLVIWDSWEMWVMQIFITPIAQMGFFAFLSVYLRYPLSETQFIVIGNALQAMSFSAVFAVANITSQDKWQGTLPSTMVTPANRVALFIGRAWFQVLLSALIAAAGLLYAATIFGVSFANADYLGIAAVVMLTAIAMTTFGLLISAVGLYMRTALIVANVFLFVTLLLSGVNFPVSVLPGWLQPVSWAIPLTYGTEAVREAIAGTSLLGLLPLLGWEALDALLVMVAGYAVFAGFESLARRTGRFEEY